MNSLLQAPPVPRKKEPFLPYVAPARHSVFFPYVSGSILFLTGGYERGAAHGAADDRRDRRVHCHGPARSQEGREGTALGTYGLTLKRVGAHQWGRPNASSVRVRRVCNVYTERNYYGSRLLEE